MTTTAKDAHQATKDIIAMLQEMGHHKLALEVAIVNLRTQWLVYRGSRLRRKVEKVNRDLQDQKRRINTIADLILLEMLLKTTEEK